MAQITTVKTTCDITGEEGQSVPFGLDGLDYDIDLAPAEEDKLRTALAPYIAAARKKTPPAAAAAPARPRGVAAAETKARKERNSAIREWARTQPQISVADRGALPEEVVAAYDRWHTGEAPSSLPAADQHAAEPHPDHADHPDHEHGHNHEAAPEQQHHAVQPHPDHEAAPEQVVVPPAPHMAVFSG